MYAIRYDAKDNILHFSLAGLWVMSDVEKFAVDISQTFLTIPEERRGNHSTLSDTAAFPVQARDVSMALGSLMDRSRALNTGRKAIVVGSMLNKLQADRTLSGPDVRTFLVYEEALAWIKSPKSATEPLDAREPSDDDGPAVGSERTDRE